MALVILDRDGVINYDSDDYIKSPDEWQPIPGSLEAIARLNKAGYRVVVASNQSSIGHRIIDIETLNAIHDRMRTQLGEVGGHIEAVFFCPHRPRDHCQCRKPRPGMLIDIGNRLRVPLDGVPVVGDAERDIEAAQAVGARPMLVLTGQGRQLAERGAFRERVEVYEDLAHAAEAIIAGGRPER